MNMMVINMQVNAIYIIIDIWHDMISAHISDVPIFIPYNWLFIVLKIGTVYVTPLMTFILKYHYKARSLNVAFP